MVPLKWFAVLKARLDSEFSVIGSTQSLGTAGSVYSKRNQLAGKCKLHLGRTGPLCLAKLAARSMLQRYRLSIHRICISVLSQCSAGREPERRTDNFSVLLQTGFIHSYGQDLNASSVTFTGLCLVCGISSTGFMSAPQYLFTEDIYTAALPGAISHFSFFISHSKRRPSRTTSTYFELEE